jgi:hypothetical protein
MYFSDKAEGAVGEAFGNFAEWSEDLFAGPPILPASRRSLGIYELDEEASILDLNDPAVLLRLGLRPSDVVARVRQTSQAWALRVYQEGKWAGIKWWSRWEPSWGSFALWDVTRLRVHDVMRLSRDHLAVAQASRDLNRRWSD